MIIQNINLPVPNNYVYYVKENNVVTYYFDNDDEVINERLRNARGEKQNYVSKKYNEAEGLLSVNKTEFYDMLGAIVAGVSRPSMNQAETMLAFKTAVEKRQSIQNKRDDLLLQIKNATVVEEIDGVVW